MDAVPVAGARPAVNTSPNQTQLVFMECAGRHARFATKPTPNSPSATYAGFVLSADETGMRILHADGMVRIWKSSALLHAPPEEQGAKATACQVCMRLAERVFLGGSTAGRQAVDNKSLDGRAIEVWFESEHCWFAGLVGKVGANGKSKHCSVRYRGADRDVTFPLNDTVWRLEGETQTSGKRERAEEQREDVQHDFEQEGTFHATVTSCTIGGEKRLRVYVSTPQVQGGAPAVSVTRTTVCCSLTNTPEGFRHVILPLPCAVLLGEQHVDSVMNGRELRITLDVDTRDTVK